MMGKKNWKLGAVSALAVGAGAYAMSQAKKKKEQKLVLKN